MYNKNLISTLYCSYGTVIIKIDILNNLRKVQIESKTIKIKTDLVNGLIY